MKKLSLALATSLALLFAASSASAAPKKHDLKAARALQGMNKAAVATPTPPPAIKNTRRMLPSATRARLAPRFRMRHLAR